MKIWLMRALAVLATLALLAWILTGPRWHGMLESLRQLNIRSLAPAVVAFAISYLLRAGRVFDEFRTETTARFSAILRLTLVHNALINILPFRSGEAAFPVLLTRWFGVPAARALVSLLWLRIQDAFVVLALTAFVWPALPIALRLLWVGIVMLAAWWIPAWAQRHPELENSAGRFKNSVHKLRTALAVSTRKNMRGWMWTIANWSLKLLAEAWLLAAVLATPLGTGMAGALGVELASILPVQGVAGFGTYESGGAALLATHGIDFTAGLNAALALHLFVIACSMLAAGLGVALLPTASQTANLDTSPP